jgi:hypothetical protein
MNGFGNIDNADLKDPAGYKDISTVWRTKDFGWILEYLAICLTMFTVATQLIKSGTFKSLELKAEPSVGFKKKSVLWWVVLAS